MVAFRRYCRPFKNYRWDGAYKITYLILLKLFQQIFVKFQQVSTSFLSGEGVLGNIFNNFQRRSLAVISIQLVAIPSQEKHDVSWMRCNQVTISSANGAA